MKQQNIFGEWDVLNKGAEFSNCGKYRYTLWRIWDRRLPLVMFIGLNPSTANSDEDDPTIKSVTRISKYNGYGGFYMMNCFPYISTNPKELIFGINIQTTQINDLKLCQISERCNDVVFAWGNFKEVNDEIVKKMKFLFPDALCIKKNKNGTPVHPLFQNSKSYLKKF